MSGQQRPCIRQDLLAVTPQWNWYSVDARGYPVEMAEEGDPTSDVEEYECRNCHDRFIPDGHSAGAVELAWQEALAHLPASQSAEASV